jgi:dienelactone hydrolase
MRHLLIVLVFLIASSATAAEDRPLAGLVAEPIMLPVTIAGEVIVLDSYVVRPERPGRFPVVILVHGTPIAEDAAALAQRSPVGFHQVAVAFAERGYASVSIMRRGFGQSGGAYAERLPQPCDFLPALRNSGDDVIAAIATLRTEPWADPDHILLLGLSTGGLAVTAADARNPSGVLAVINFDGGRHAIRADGQACSPAHGARPEESIDPVLVACHIGAALQSIISRNVPPRDTAALSITRIIGGDAYNVIPETATLSGTARTMRRETMTLIEQAMQRLVPNIALGFGAAASVDFRLIFAPLINHPEHAREIADIAAELVGEENVDRNKPPAVASEDFSFMLEQVPGAYINIGNGEQSAPVHNPKYNFNDDAIPFGSALFARLVERRLARESGG